MKLITFDIVRANTDDISACSAGVAMLNESDVIDSKHWLIKPPAPYDNFLPRFSEKHGMTSPNVQDAPDFPTVAPQIFADFLAADAVVIYDIDFVLSKLHGVASHFGQTIPDFNSVCLLQLARKTWPDLPSYSLSALSHHIGRGFHDGNAHTRTEVAAGVMVALMKEAQIDTVKSC